MSFINMTYYEFELDSLDASYAFSSAYSSKNWPVFLLGGKQPLENIDALKIVEVQIPFSWYTITENNNTFTVTVPTDVTTTITLTPGNYTISQMITELNLQLGGIDVWLLSTAFNQITQKITFSSTAPSARAYSLYFDPASNLNQILGFNTGTTNWVWDAENEVNYTTAVSCCAITGPNYLYMNSSKIGNLTTCLLPKGSYNQGNAGMQIAKIPVNVQPGGVIYWQDPVPEKWFNMDNLNQLTELDLFITVGNNPVPVDLNGLPFSVKFAVTTLDFMTTRNSSGADSEFHVVKKVKRV